MEERERGMGNSRSSSATHENKASLNYLRPCPPDTIEERKVFFCKKVQSFGLFNQGTLLTGGNTEFLLGFSKFLFICM